MVTQAKGHLFVALAGLSSLSHWHPMTSRPSPPANTYALGVLIFPPISCPNSLTPFTKPTFCQERPMCNPRSLTSHSPPNPGQLRALLQTPRRWPSLVTTNLHVSHDNRHLCLPLTAIHALLQGFLTLSSWSPH